MLKDLRNIVEFTQSILLMIGNILAGMVQLLTMLPSAISMVLESVTSMPTVLVAFASGLIMVSVIYLIVGRV